jgi:hypothetical protein
MSREDRMFLKNSAKQIETQIGPDMHFIPMSRPRIRYLINKMKLKPIGAQVDSSHELEEALLIS